MFRFNNTHIFTGYLKKLLASYSLPTCRIYTNEFTEYLKAHGEEDPRVIESFDNLIYDDKLQRVQSRIYYLKNNEIYSYFWNHGNKSALTERASNSTWSKPSAVFYQKDRQTHGLTRRFNGIGNQYDFTTHEYLGDYLRFMRDYHNLNLMSLYNCFSNNLCNNIYYKQTFYTANPDYVAAIPESASNKKYLNTYDVVFDSLDSNYNIYMLPVKLFEKYTIAIDCGQSIDMFCGFYNTSLDTSDKARDLMAKTYKKVCNTVFKQPFIYDKLEVSSWNFNKGTEVPIGALVPNIANESVITRWDIANREQDLKLFIRIPVSCKSSITILEGDFRFFNDSKYALKEKESGSANPRSGDTWEFKQNHTILNFDTSDKNIDLNNYNFKPISKLQLLAMNTGESYPFADRLVEYLSNSAITPLDEIPDNIKRVQNVMNQNKYYFKVDGLWEDKMQKIIYDYIMNSGPISEISTEVYNSDGTKDETKSLPIKQIYNGEQPEDTYIIKVNDSTNIYIKKDSKLNKTLIKNGLQGYHFALGHKNKSVLYDTLGYVDKDVEKWYANWRLKNNKAIAQDTIQNVDIYNGLFDI